MEDREFFSSEKVYVSLTRFVVDGETYAMNNVTSVRAEELRPYLVWLWALAIAGLLCFFGDWTWMVLGVTLVAAAVVLGFKQSPSYCISLRSASGEVNVLHSDDREFVSKVLQALNDCIVARG